jgi:hypothetical protein
MMNRQPPAGPVAVGAAATHILVVADPERSA